MIDTRKKIVKVDCARLSATKSPDTNVPAYPDRHNLSTNIKKESVAPKSHEMMPRY